LYQIYSLFAFSSPKDISNARSSDSGSYYPIYLFFIVSVKSFLLQFRQGFLFQDQANDKENRPQRCKETQNMCYYQRTLCLFIMLHGYLTLPCDLSIKVSWIISTRHFRPFVVCMFV